MNQSTRSLKAMCRLLLMMLGILQLGALSAQSIVVKGTIKDAKGEPLPGATVQVKEPKAVVAADVTGVFRINASGPSVTITVSMTGYTPSTLTVPTNKDITVVLQESTTGLGEVVVVGYGQQKRATVVGSVSQISGEQLKQMPAMNVTNMLSGRLPGLTTLQQSGRPGADDATLRIRGTGTYGAAAPLIIIDDVQRPSFSNLDPNEIESITILKDAVSTAVYGLQAANGIILITTKKGKNQRPVVSYSGAVTRNQNTRFPKFLNGPDYMEWYNKGTDMDNDYRENNGLNLVPYTYTQEQIDALRNGTNTNPMLGNTDWIGLLTGNKAYSQQHNVEVRGGTDKIKYFTSAGMLSQDGVVKNTGFKRYNVRANVQADLSDLLTVGMNIGARQQLGRTPGISPDNTAYMNPFYQAVRMLPNMPMYSPDGLPVAYYSNAGWVNPIAAVERSGYQNSESNVFQGQVNATLKIPYVKGLEVKLLTAYDKTSTENKGWLTNYDMMGRDRDQVTGNWTPIFTQPGVTKNSLRQSYGQNYRKTFQPSINYNNSFGDHGVSALLLYEWSQAGSSIFSTGASNFQLTDIKEIDYGSTDPNDWISPTGSSRISNSRAGLVARLNYNYKEKYLLEIANRWDASVNFTKENRWAAFPALGLGWVISKEDFFNNVPEVDFIKLKGSVGRLGNDNTSPFSYMQTYMLTDGPVMVIGGAPTPALYTSAPPNVNIHWETAMSYSGGFESIFYKGKLALDVEFFYKKTSDILDNPGTQVPLSMGGYAPASFNYGIMDNRGIDLQIRHRNNIGKFEYGVTGNFNWARNKVLRRAQNAGVAADLSIIGRPVSTKYGFIADGMYQNWKEALDAPSPSGGVVAPGFFRYRDLNGDGRITRTDDFTVIGRSNMPELMYGLNIDMRYGQFDFTALLQGAALCDVSLAGTYEGSSGTSGVDDNTPFTKPFYGYGNAPYFLVENAWSPENPNAEFPRLTAYKASLSAHNAHINSGWIRDGSYLRLKSAQLGYTLPKHLVKAAKIESFRIYASGFNLITWDKLKYLDPEMPNVNNGFYPQQRMYTAGVNVTF
jgi:TonB-linked SusC/RagA family outer membrane protein